MSLNLLNCPRTMGELVREFDRGVGIQSRVWCSVLRRRTATREWETKAVESLEVQWTLE
jgi:hypothetical protein